ncbi:Gfo/Idh/MocA family protein [Microbacterium esteraromaticum]|uniref:Gfo/Idh/MocA family protein n=1 Tax=Microbacterium esteraromaticum TaxID=57043 RepID=UPI0019D3B16F|nr:Gfo/Idh/MocA family oxidoreductase [Microbacterium esteraromaticum]MBN7793867.1 Gfo/Idh/MocA family oxidoreductase [Microbacterium esteraromaticum]
MIDIALIGLAHPHAAYYVREIETRSDIRCVAVSDPDRRLCDEYAARLRVPGYAQHTDLLHEHSPAVIGVAGIYGQRHTVVLDALLAGAHVLADKPLCTSLDQLDRIELLAAQRGKMVALMLEKRSYPATLAARALWEQGEIGDVVSIAATGPHKLNPATRPSWFWEPNAYGGVLTDLAVHDIDLAVLFTGMSRGTVVGVAGSSTYSPQRGFQDYGSLLLAGDDAVATIEAHWLWPEGSPWHGEYRMRLTGTEGVAELNWAENTVDLTTRKAPPLRVAVGPGKRPAEPFFDAVLAGRAPEVSTAESIRASRIALLAQRSADHHGAPQPWSMTNAPDRGGRR